MNIGESAVDAIVVKRQLLMIETQQVKNGGMQVINGTDRIHGLMAKFVGGSMREGSLYTSTREPYGEPVWIMVASVGPLLKRWHPPEVGHPYNQSVFE